MIFDIYSIKICKSIDMTICGLCQKGIHLKDKYVDIELDVFGSHEHTFICKLCFGLKADELFEKGQFKKK